MTVKNIPPHGGTLIDRVLRAEAREAALERAAQTPRVVLNPVNVSDLELIAIGAFSPLTGFMGSADYASVVDDMRLANGLIWSIPVTLAVPEVGVCGGLPDGGDPPVSPPPSEGGGGGATLPVLSSSSSLVSS